jgi:hypothetical protein
MPRGSCKNRRFAKAIASLIGVITIGELGTMFAVTSNRSNVLRLLVTANIPSSPILVTLMMEAKRSFETSVLTRSRWRNIPEYGILHSHRRENLKSYIALTSCARYRRTNVFPVRCELGFYIPEDDILHSHCSKKHQILYSLAVSAFHKRNDIWKFPPPPPSEYGLCFLFVWLCRCPKHQLVTECYK